MTYRRHSDRGTLSPGTPDNASCACLQHMYGTRSPGHRTMLHVRASSICMGLAVLVTGQCFMGVPPAYVWYYYAPYGQITCKRTFWPGDFRSWYTRQCFMGLIVITHHLNFETHGMDFKKISSVKFRFWVVWPSILVYTWTAFISALTPYLNQL